MRRPALLVAVLPMTAFLLSPVVASGPTVVHAFNPATAPEIQDRLLDSAGEYAFGKAGPPEGNSQHIANYQPSSQSGCSQKLAGNNVKVNQNCLNLTDPDLQGRAQAQNETSIAADPSNQHNLIASYNDYRRGDGNCYTASSSDGGSSWTDSTPPMSFTRGTGGNDVNGSPVNYGGVRQYWEAGGDTSVAYDTKGNAYLSCQVFQRGAGVAGSNPDTSSAFFLFRSTGNNGLSWNFPARPIAQAPNPSNTSNNEPFLDKQLMTVDNHVGSPFQDRIYVTWTSFAADGSAYIYGAWSSNYGETFSAPVVVSGNSPVCTYTYGAGTPQGNCNENQFSQPFTGSDGSLYVSWANFNNSEAQTAAAGGNDNRNQMLLSKSSDGGQHFSQPVRVGYYYDLPDCATYQGGKDLGRACVPEKGSSTNSVFRATNLPSGAANPTNHNQLVVNFGSYINPNSNESNGCVPGGISLANGGTNLYAGVKTAGACNNDIMQSVSNDGGATWSAGSKDPRVAPTVTGAGAQGSTDQWWQWTAFTKDGRLAVSYYDRQYGNDESNGFSDLSLSGSKDMSTFKSVRVTGSAMPPPTQFGGVFFGDYTGLTTSGNTAYPLWMDTRNPDLFLCGPPSAGHPPAICTGTEANGLQANDQDIFTASVGVPS